MKRKDKLLLWFCGILMWCLVFEVGILKNFEQLYNYLQRFDASSDIKNFFAKTPLSQDRLFLIDKKLLQILNKMLHAGEAEENKCLFCNVKRYQPITFALLCPTNSSLEEHVLLPILKAWEIGFWVETIINSRPKKFSVYRANLPLGFILQKDGSLVIEIVLLHEREGDFWWHGSLDQDVLYESKLSNLKIRNLKNNLVLNREGALDKFHVKSVDIDGNKVNVPYNIELFLKESTQFIECNYELADKYYRTFGKDTTVRALKFVHTARKLLSRTKFILDQLQVPFWISSGTLLGYHRQCDIIPYSRDIDIGIFIQDYKAELIDKFKSNSLKLIYKFGRISEAFELSFVSNRVKLDIFFFYDDGVSYWNGAHLIKRRSHSTYTAERYKYSFPKFNLCWTEFLDLKIRIPCDTETYIRANYGPNWFTPLPQWDSIFSPFNAQSLGEWKKSEIKDVIKIY